MCTCLGLATHRAAEYSPSGIFLSLLFLSRVEGPSSSSPSARSEGELQKPNQKGGAHFSSSHWEASRNAIHHAASPAERTGPLHLLRRQASLGKTGRPASRPCWATPTARYFHRRGFKQGERGDPFFPVLFPFFSLLILFKKAPTARVSERPPRHPARADVPGQVGCKGLSERHDKFLGTTRHPCNPSSFRLTSAVVHPRHPGVCPKTNTTRHAKDPDQKFRSLDICCWLIYDAHPGVPLLWEQQIYQPLTVYAAVSSIRVTSQTRVVGSCRKQGKC